MTRRAFAGIAALSLTSIMLAPASADPVEIDALRAAAKTHAFGCGAPFHRRLARAELLAAFGRPNVKDEQTATDPEGMNPATQTVLFDNTPADRIALILGRDGPDVTVEGHSRWTGPGGLHVGSTLAEVVKANGGPFSLTGLGTPDAGGIAVLAFEGPSKAKHSGCRMWVYFTSNPSAPAGETEKAEAEDSTIMSTDPVLAAARPLVAKISLSYCSAIAADSAKRC
jgi:hypothetical protein